MSHSLPATMRAQTIENKTLSLKEVALPEIGKGEVLIKVDCAGINRPDILQRQGLYPAPQGHSPLPGLEVAGTVVRTADGSIFKTGDRVCALTNGGGYAEYCAVPSTQCLPIPSGFSPEQAAALPETLFTVWTNLFDRCHLKAGERILVHGGTSGIGTTAIQLASAFGAEVFTTAGSEEKCQACLKLGAKAAINYREEDFEPAFKTLEQLNEPRGDQLRFRGFDIILDMVGGDYIPKNLRLLAVEGRLCMIAFLGGSTAELDLMHLMLKRQTITGSTLRARPDQEKAVIARSLHERVWPLLEQGKLAPVLNRTFPFEQANEAHALMESSSHIGKIVLKIGEQTPQKT